MFQIGQVITMEVAAARYLLQVLETDTQIASFIKPYSQRDPRWRDATLGKSHLTIGKGGCALTCAAMICSRSDPTMTPLKLNNLLRGVDGFNGGFLKWGSIQKVFNDVFYFGPTNVINDGWGVWRNGPANMVLFWKELGLAPLITEVDFTPGESLDNHFVLALRESDAGDLVIIDPWDGSTTRLLERYGATNWGLARAIYGIRILRNLDTIDEVTNDD